MDAPSTRPATPSAARPGPWRLTFVTNPDECDLACRMCREHSPLSPLVNSPPRRLPLATVEKILRDLAGTPLAEIVPSTVGEPLLWSGLPELAALCGPRGLRLNVTTNGTWPKLGGAGWARILAGACSDVKVSWNGATPETAATIMGIRLRDAQRELAAFVAVRDELRRAGRTACAVSLQVTAQEQNVGELPAIVRFAAALGLERVKVNQLQVHFQALASEDLRRSFASRERWNAAVQGMRQESMATAASPAPGEHRPRLQGDVEMDGSGPPAAAARCPFLGREAWIAVDGRFAPCPAPAAKEGRLGDFGSPVERPFAEIWNGAAYRSLCESHQTNPACADCALRRPGGI